MTYEYELIGGLHDQGDGKVYRRGDHLESGLELDKLHPGKFRRMGAGGVAAAEPEKKPADSLDGMTVAQLREFAEGEEIDLGSATKKSEIVKTIRAASWD